MHFIHSFSKYLLKAYTPGTVPGTEDLAVHNQTKIPATSDGKETINKAQRKLYGV